MGREKRERGISGYAETFWDHGVMTRSSIRMKRRNNDLTAGLHCAQRLSCRRKGTKALQALRSELQAIRKLACIRRLLPVALKLAPGAPNRCNPAI